MSNEAGETSNLDDYSESTNTTIIVVLICFSLFTFIVNLFAVVSILRNSSASMISFLVCFLSTLELMQAITCATTTLYSYLETANSFEENSLLCAFYGWLYVAFRTWATLLVSLLTLDRIILSLRPNFYIRKWTSLRSRWILSSSTLIIAVLLASLPLVNSSYHTSPDGRRFHCLFQYKETYALFYIVFHLVQTLSTLVAIPWIISREKRVDARLSVLLAGEMAVHRKGRNVVTVRDGLKMSRLVAAVGVVYHGCSILLPLLLILRFFDVDYPAVLGLLALQLPTFGALFYPVVYGWTWKPYRSAYYSSVSCLCPSTRVANRRRVRSIYNPAFHETRDYDGNSIFHTKGINLHQGLAPPISNQSCSSSGSEPPEPDSRQLSPKPTTVADVSRRPHLVLPRATSFQDRHFYMPSKFQNIFEIIDALSQPHWRTSDDASECSSSRYGTTDGRRHDSLDSSGTDSPVKLNDVSVNVQDFDPSTFNDVDFSAIHVSSSPFNEKVVNKVKLDFERKNSNKGQTTDTTLQRPSEKSSSFSGPVRFTDLKKTQSETGRGSSEKSFKTANQERLLRYPNSDVIRQGHEEPSSLSGPVRFTDLRTAPSETRSKSSKNYSEIKSPATVFRNSYLEEIYRKQPEEPSSQSGQSRFMGLRKAPSESRSKIYKNHSEIESPGTVFRNSHLEEVYRKQLEEPSSQSGQIHFTDLRKAQIERSQESRNDSGIGNSERFLKYLASQSYLDRS